VNYWSDDDEEPLYKQYIRYPGQVDQGVVIGLWADSNFWFEVLVYNTAGLGPVSEKFVQETLHLGKNLIYAEKKKKIIISVIGLVYLKTMIITFVYLCYYLVIIYLGVKRRRKKQEDYSE